MDLEEMAFDRYMQEAFPDVFNKSANTATAGPQQVHPQDQEYYPELDALEGTYPQEYDQGYNEGYDDLEIMDENVQQAYETAETELSEEDKAQADALAYLEAYNAVKQANMNKQASNDFYEEDDQMNTADQQAIINQAYSDAYKEAGVSAAELEAAAWNSVGTGGLNDPFRNTREGKRQRLKNQTAGEGISNANKAPRNYDGPRENTYHTSRSTKARGALRRAGGHIDQAAIDGAARLLGGAGNSKKVLRAVGYGAPVVGATAVGAGALLGSKLLKRRAVEQHVGRKVLNSLKGGKGRAALLAAGALGVGGGVAYANRKRASDLSPEELYAMAYEEALNDLGYEGYEEEEFEKTASEAQAFVDTIYESVYPEILAEEAYLYQDVLEQAGY